MTTITKLQVYPRCLEHRLGFMDHQRVGSRLNCRYNRVYVHRCEGDSGEKKVERRRKREKLKGNGLWSSLKSGVLGVSKLGFLSKDEYNQKIEKLEMVFSSIAVQIARYIVTMTSTGAILLIGFQLSGGDSSMNSLVWYSWLGGVIIGTMTGANMVLEDHYRAGPRNVVITGSTRGLGKALAREFLLSGDRVIVTSRSSESVDMTVKELEQNLKEIMSNASESARKKLADAKVVGIACDVCKPEDVEKLSNFAVKELGSINIWINNAGTNKGFRPLLDFTEEDIRQIVSTNLIGSILCTRGAMEVMSSLTSAGCRVKIWIADWFAYMNNKLGGDLKKIRVVGEYFKEIFQAAGMNCENVEFLWSSEEINARGDEYWPLVMDIACRNSLAKIKRCMPIMGHSEAEELSAAHILYVCMQCADTLFLEADICQLGMDQETVNLLARDYCDDINRGNKPVILSHHMLRGLQQGQTKMSKSDPSSAIFMEDEEAEVNVKIKKAYCPPGIVEGNPCVEYVRYIILPWFNEFTVERDEKYGGSKTYKSYEDIVTDYESNVLHPKDLKDALSKALNKILQPVRDHFKTNSRAKNLLKQVKGYKITRTALSKEMEALSVNAPNPASSAAGLQLSEEVENKYNIVRSIGEECIQEDELKNLLAKKPTPICYDGFEPSGRMHIAQGVMKVTNVNKLTTAGCQVKIWIADWFAQLNNKLGGDLERIKVVGEYFKEIWQAGGMNTDKVSFLWASDEINGRGGKYWPLVMDIARRNNLRRILRCGQIMGRSETEVLSAAQILYPCMQCADIFLLEADICQLGMDQRKVNMLAREYCDDIKRKNKPIILSHHMLPGLQQGQEKMSKSNPSSAIFMEDEEADVNEKISKAYCPARIVEGNPCLEYVKYLVLPRFNEFTVETDGSNKTFKSFEDIVADYENGALAPEDLKKALVKALNIMLQPVRDHFKTNDRAKNLLEQVKAFRVTR